MPRLRLYEFELTLTDVIDKKDKKGDRYLLAKGYHTFVAVKLNGNHYKAYDQFSSIQLYGTNQILDETIRRMQSEKTHKIVIDVLDSDLVNKLKDKKLLSMLVVYWFDFKKRRFGTRKLIKKYEREEI